MPVEVTLLKIDGELVPLEMATREEQIQYQAGEIEGVIQTRYGMKAVFDIAQTVCPVELYQHFHKQYRETEREQLVKGMTEILEGMEYQIRYQNLSDFGKDWIFTESGNVVLHEHLHPEEKLSALAEVYSKAVIGMEESRKSPEVLQFQTEGLRLMTEGVLGIKRDRTEIAEIYEQWKQSGQKIHLQQTFQELYQMARKGLPHLEQIMERYTVVSGTDPADRGCGFEETKRTGNEDDKSGVDGSDQTTDTDHRLCKRKWIYAGKGRQILFFERTRQRADRSKPELLLAELRGRKNRDWKRGQYYWICKRLCTSRRSARSIKGVVRESAGDDLSARRLTGSKRRNKKI